jgi:chromosome segregation ATPase
MPRTPTVDRSELKIRVVEAVQSYRGEGRTPTVSLVRHWLTERYKSAGSQTILKDVIKEVLEEIAATEDAGAPALPMPAEVETNVQAAIQTIWRVASRAAFADYHERRSRADAEIKEATAGRELAEDQLAGAQEERDGLEKEFGEAQETLRKLERRLAAAEGRGEGLQKQLEAAEAGVQQERIAAAEAQGKLADMRDRLARADAAHEAVDRRRAELEQEGKDLADRLRTADARAAELERRLDAAEARASAEREGFGKLEDSLRRQVEEAKERARKMEELMARMAPLLRPAEEGDHQGAASA